jgi:fused signal recognition particle receptor
MVKSVQLDLHDGLNLFLVLGVNGVGKTTSIGKIAKYYQKKGTQGLVLAAGDTFRAAAIDQLVLHAQRLDVRVVKQQPGSDPGAVIYDALDSAGSRGEQLVIADTAGRMHNKANLVKELQKIHKIAEKKMGGKPYKKLLVVDATTGQNALQQAQIFHEAVGVDALILSKMDSTGKGGVAVAISQKLGLPFAFLGLGESQDDLMPFQTEDYLQRLLGDQ